MNTEVATDPGNPWPPGSLLSQLDADDRSALLRLGTQRRFQRGETFIHEGDKDRSVFVILDGFAKVMGGTEDGRTNILAIRVAGDLVGEFAALDEQPRSASVAAATEMSARRIDLSSFVTLLKDRPALHVLVHRNVLTKIRQATFARLNLGGASVDVRLTHILQRLASSCGRKEPGETVIDIPLSQLECAELIGASVQSVERSLAQLRRQGLIITGYRRIAVANLEGLRIAANGLSARKRQMS